MLLFILLIGVAGLIWNINGKDVDFIPESFDAKRASADLSQEYTDEHNYISVKYPDNWSLKFNKRKYPFENNENNSFGAKNFDINGPEGTVTVTWEDTYGGGCSAGYTKFDLKNRTVAACHFFDSENQNRESWHGIQQKVNSDTELGVYISAHVSENAPENSNVINAILSSIKINSKE